MTKHGRFSTISGRGLVAGSGKGPAEIAWPLQRKQELSIRTRAMKSIYRRILEEKGEELKADTKKRRYRVIVFSASAICG